MEHNTNIAVWFEIPATDFARAVTFYQTIMEVELERFEMAELQMGLFPHDHKPDVSGAVVCGNGYVPSQNGPILYLNGGADLSVALSKVETAGGKVLLPKTHLSDEIGYIAHLMDTEGNRIALHSMS